PTLRPPPSLHDALPIWSRASVQRLRPTPSALRPPIPASISSNTSVGVASASASTSLTASATRDSSPPDAIRDSGRAGSPGFGARSEEHTSELQSRFDLV